MMISPFGFPDDVSKDCFSDDVKTAIWPASVPILDGWHAQLLLGKIQCVTFWVSQSTPKREATIRVRIALATAHVLILLYKRYSGGSW
jgi:hypothetical protein